METAVARIHVMGASGAGTTTLGAALAKQLGLFHLDTDDLYWMATDPPYTTPRPMEERLALFRSRAPVRQGWVLSGSALKWGAPIEPLYDLIIFLRIDPAMRMTRIRRRETARYGARILPGGDMAERSEAFLIWAESYDAAGPDCRSLCAHQAWLATQSAPVIALDSSRPLSALVEAVCRHPVLARELQAQDG
jgi:adenylate kinase family enzyme